jgi:thioredoxin 1
LKKKKAVGRAVGKVHKISSRYALNQALDAAKKHKKLVVLDFYADWCGPCKQLAPWLGQQAAKHKKRVQFLKVDVDDCREVSQLYDVKSMPTIVFFVKGKVVGRVTGADKQGILDQIGMAKPGGQLFRALSRPKVVLSVLVAYLGTSVFVAARA